MRVLPFLFLVCAFSLRSARAQVAAKEAPSTPIRYSRDVPQSVLKLMPRGAKSLFWGKFAPKKGGGLMAIHLFNQTPKEPRYNVTRSLGLNLFEWQKHKWRKVKSISVQYLTAFSGTDKAVNAQFFWIDSQEKIPLLKLRVFDPDGFSGAIGDEVAVAFPSGFQQTATIQSWAWGQWSSSTGGRQLLDWNQRDENGFLKIVIDTFTRDEFNPKHRNVWGWCQSKFTLDNS